MTWPPLLPEHRLLERWRPVHHADAEGLRATPLAAGCEAVDVVALDRERGVRQVVTAFRRRPSEERPDAPEKPAPTGDVAEAVRRAREAHGAAAADDAPITDAQLALLRELAADPRESVPVRESSPTWSDAWRLRRAGLLVLEPPPPDPYAQRRAWRPATDLRPWRATVTDSGRRVLEPYASASAALDASLGADETRGDEGEVEQAIARMRTRWSDVDVDAIELERVLRELLPDRHQGPPRTLLLVVDGRARAFERLGRNPRGGWRWRSMHVFTIADVRRFAEGARR